MRNNSSRASNRPKTLWTPSVFAAFVAIVAVFAHLFV
jgi:hypothetical protein